jgi:phosphoribosylformylglycinamidine cyclo-ligase
VITYKSAGVDYDYLDEAKRAASKLALGTSHLLHALGGEAVDASRGGSAFVFRLASTQLAFVVEGLGTKAIIAREFMQLTGRSRFDDIGRDAFAAIVNDLCSVGALPAVVNAYFATGNSLWYHESPERARDLIHGWQRACVEAGAVWGGGESPTLPGVVAEGEIELAGAAVGVIPEGHGPILGKALAPGDDIVLVASSGLHANGASLARLVASRLPEGLLSLLPSGRSLGDAVLDPTYVYAPLVRGLLEADIPVSYISHITGHGFRKIMRPPQALTYRIDLLPPVPEVLTCLCEVGELDQRTAYGTFNMGAGLAVYCPAGRGEDVVGIASGLGLSAMRAGSVEQGPRRVVLEPLGITFDSDELSLS